MINNKRRKITAIFMAAVVSVNLSGCSFKSEKRENKEVLEYLENKYDKKFEISEHLERVGAGPFKPQEFKRGKAYCTDNQLENFDVILYDDGLCKDNYQNMIMEVSVKEYYENIVKQYWNDSKILIDLNYGETNEIFDGDSTYNYLLNSGVSTTIWIYIPQNNSFDIKQESKRIYNLTEQLFSLSLNGEIVIGYTNKDIDLDNIEVNNDQIWNECRQNGIIDKIFSKVITANINGRINTTTAEEIEGQIKKRNNL